MMQAYPRRCCEAALEINEETVLLWADEIRRYRQNPVGVTLELSPLLYENGLKRFLVSRTSAEAIALTTTLALDAR